MSLGTILGFFATFGLIAGSILMSTNNPASFVDIPSFLIVIGGSIGACFISYEFKTAKKALGLTAKAFKKHKDSDLSLKDQVGLMVKWGYVVQKNGLQGLESEITDDFRSDNEFLSYGVDLVVTGYTGVEIKQILTQSIEATENREKVAIDALKKMGGDAPAFGMLGTLIGLVIMLGNMGGDPASIGPSMAIALITTFYGVFAARIVFIPLATKIAARGDRSIFKNYLQVEGLILLAERKSPRFIQDKLNSFVEASEQFSIDDDMKTTTTTSEEQ